MQNPPKYDDFYFRIETWADDDSAIESVIALANESRIARAAYDAAVKVYPGKRLTLRAKAQVMEQNVPVEAEQRAVLKSAIEKAHYILAEKLEGRITAETAVERLLLVLDNEEVMRAT